jgi:hypothetical protein
VRRLLRTLARTRGEVAVGKFVIVLAVVLLMAGTYFLVNAVVTVTP